MIVLEFTNESSSQFSFPLSPRCNLIQEPPMTDGCYRSSSSSAHPSFRRLTTIFSSFCSAMALSSCLSCSSVTFCCNCPVRASMINRFSTSVARDSLTSRIRPKRSAASGRRIWLRMDCRASAEDEIKVESSQRGHIAIVDDPK